MVERSRCCWYDVVGAWWKPRRAERFFEELQLDTIHSVLRRRRTEFDQPAEARAKICACSHVCAYHVDAHRVLACQSFSGQAPSPRLRGFLHQHHLIPSSPSCYGADLLFCSNLLKCHGTGKPNNTWLNHFLGSPLPRRY